MKLKKSIVLFRHGARTYTKELIFVEKMIPSMETMIWDKEKLSTASVKIEDHINLITDDGSDPYHEIHKKPDSTLDGGCLYGELTTVGHEQAKKLGEWLKERYIETFKLINEHYNKEEISLSSTNMRRTIMTLMGVLDGMYSIQTNGVKPTVVTRSLRAEYIIPNWHPSNEIGIWMKHMFENIFTFFPHQKEIHDNLEKHTKVDLTKEPVALVSLHDIIQCRKVHSMAVPEYMKDFEPDISRSASEIFSKGFEGNKRSEKLWIAVGKLLDQLIVDISNENSTKLHVYSAHDVTVMVLLMAFDHWTQIWPTFCASLCIEVYEDKDGEKYIQILYEREVLTFTVSGKDLERIPVQQFIDGLSKYRWSTMNGK